MTTLGFKGDFARLLWSTTSPDEGSPTCLCSYCGALIPEHTVCVRMWRTTSAGVTEEARLCNPCAEANLGVKTID